MNTVVFGGGSWGTALSHVLAHAGHTVRILVRDESLAANINTHHENKRYLAGLTLHPAVTAHTDSSVLSSADLCVLAIPCQSQRNVLLEARRFFRPETMVVNASKGIELATGIFMSQVVADALGFDADQAARYAVLSGPSFARETLQAKPTAVVLACRNEETGKELRQVFATPWFRTYSSTDVLGVELGGAVKNVIAIAAGISDGLDFGHNARAALVTRGLAEISRLGLTLGADPLTFMGLSGIGDLMLTCAGDLSRNRQVGLRLGRGESLDSIIQTMGSVAEGVATARAVSRLAHKHNVDMPITHIIESVLDNALSPADAVSNLMARSLKKER